MTFFIYYYFHNTRKLKINQIKKIKKRTGVSGYDRAQTCLALASKTSKAEDFHRPGHIFPLVARPGGVLERRGHTEASYDLCRVSLIFLFLKIFFFSF